MSVSSLMVAESLEGFARVDQHRRPAVALPTVEIAAMLNTPVDVDKIRAELKNGELRLTVPKAEGAKTRRIQIRSS